MDALWKIALTVGGGSAIGAILFWALYSKVVEASFLSTMTSDQTFWTMIIFMALTFLSLVTFVLAFRKRTRASGGSITQHASGEGINLVNSGKSTITINKK